MDDRPTWELELEGLQPGDVDAYGAVGEPDALVPIEAWQAARDRYRALAGARGRLGLAGQPLESLTARLEREQSEWLNARRCA